MVSERMGRRARLARRLLDSAFVVVHVGATVLWVMPPCPLRNKVIGPLCYYILPLGLWQCWTMFSPDPPPAIRGSTPRWLTRNPGLGYNYAFPRQSEYSVWCAIPRYRHPKFAVDRDERRPRSAPSTASSRARPRRRQLSASQPRSFPIDVSLIFKGLIAPPAREPPPDGPRRKEPFPSTPIGSEGINEVRP